MKKIKKKKLCDNPVRKEDVLKTALKVLAEREKTHGCATANMDDIAILWTVYLSHQIDAKDVAIMNILQKVSRLKASNHPDNPIDIAGYAAILGEVME